MNSVCLFSKRVLCTDKYRNQKKNQHYYSRHKKMRWITEQPIETCDNQIRLSVMLSMRQNMQNNLDNLNIWIRKILEIYAKTAKIPIDISNVTNKNDFNLHEMCIEIKIVTNLSEMRYPTGTKQVKWKKHVYLIFRKFFWLILKYSLFPLTPKHFSRQISLAIVLKLLNKRLRIMPKTKRQ